MSKFTLSRTIPPAIFTGTILASYALWESHAPYKKEATPQANSNSCALSFFVISGSPPEITDAIITCFLGISKAGESLVVVMRLDVRTLSKSG